MSFVKALNTLFPDESNVVIGVLMVHPQTCTCALSMQAYRVMGAMCFAMEAYKKVIKNDLDLLSDKKDDLTRNQVKTAFDAIHKTGLEAAAAEILCVKVEFNEFQRIGKLHAKAVDDMESDPNVMTFDDLMRRLFGGNIS